MCPRPPLTRHLGHKMEAVDEKNMEELSFVPTAVSEPCLALHMCDNKCLRNCGYCVRKKKEVAEVNDVKWMAMIEQKASRGSYGHLLGSGTILVKVVGHSAIEKAIGLGNTRRRTRRS